MAALKIPQTIYLEMLGEAEKQNPLEACGLLAGKGCLVQRFYALTNVEQSKTHFSMDPVEQFAVLRNARGNGWGIIAIWHSHPETPPRMSQEDKKMAFMPDVSYAIISLAANFRGDLRAFRLWDNEFVEEEIKIFSPEEPER